MNDSKQTENDSEKDRPSEVQESVEETMQVTTSVFDINELCLLADRRLQELAAEKSTASTENLTQLPTESNELEQSSVEINRSKDGDNALPVETLLCSLHSNSDNFFKGCKWAPDGLCLMTNSDDNKIRLINTPSQVLAKQLPHDNNLYEIDTCLTIKEAETIYDFEWWPLMNSIYPSTCCLATTARDQPIHLWDAFSGNLRATYIARNNVDEVKCAHSLGFSRSGEQMICGFNKELRLFYLDRPGDNCEIWPTSKLKCSSGQKGIISTTEFSPDDSTIACGCYDGTAAMYSSKNGHLLSTLYGNCGSITYIKFSPDGYRIYTGSRKNNNIVCWDLRSHQKKPLFHIQREVCTNQRIFFDIASHSFPNRDSSRENVVISGNTDGAVSMWDVTKYLDVSESFADQPLLPLHRFTAHNDCVNGVSLHPYLPVLATSSGQRQFPEMYDSDEEEGRPTQKIEENCLKLWHLENLRCCESNYMCDV